MKFLFNKQDVYRETFYLYQYNENDFRICLQKFARQKGFEEEKKTGYIPQTEPEEVQRVSLSRTKRHIRELALCNGFEYFATLTVDSANADRFSLTDCQDLLRKKLKKLKRKNSDFAYLFITEKHKNGAFHFHGLVKGINDFYINSNGYLSHEVFDEIGFNSFSKIHDFEKTCNYITKYITKDCIKNEHNQIYFCSRGLKKATKYIIKPDFDIDFTYENDFCKLRDFHIPDMSQEELLKFMLLKEGK